MAKKPSIAGEALGLFTDIINGVRAALKKLGGSDARLEKLREARFFEIAAAYAMGAVITISAAVQTALQFADRVVTITMDTGKTLAQLTADGKYDWVNSDIGRLFTVESAGGTQSREIILLHYEKTMTSEAVLADMDRQELRAATLLELHWIGIQYPLLQRDFPIIALGSILKLRDNRHVAYLFRNDLGRSMNLHWFGSDWTDICRFAAVRK